MKRKDDSLEWHDENELVRKLDVVETVLNLADIIDDVVDVIMSVPNTDAPYIDIETGILHWHGWEYRRIEDCCSTADTPQMNRIKTADYCDICNHKGCDNCTANSLDDYCVPSGYAPKDTPQTDERSE